MSGDLYTAADPATIDRRGLLSSAKRVIVKIGSGVLTDDAGRLDVPWVDSLANDIAAVVERGREVIVVSSGAVGAGLGVMLPKRPVLARERLVADEQALAAIGQSMMIEVYRRAFGRRGIEVAQVLLTRGDMEELRRYMNARRTLDRLLRWGVLPIINENDTTTIDELRMGDNDELSAIIGRKMRADLLVMLTSADGLMTGDPRDDPEARVVPVVASIDAAAVERVEVAPSKSGRGGIKGKLRAALSATDGGLATVIANGRRPGALPRILEGDPDVGTLFLARAGQRLNPIRNFLITEKSRSDCRIVVNSGAAAALQKNGASLLPVGIERLDGVFEAGDVVQIVDRDGKAIAKGISTYSRAELDILAGHKTAKIAELIGRDDGPTAVHRDCLVLL